MSRALCRGSRETNEASGLGDPSMMKSFALLMITFALLAFCSFARAQDQEPNIDSKIAVARANMRADRYTIITTAMNFSEKEAAVFWPIYRQYEYERSK